MFANMEEVAYVYSETREGDLLQTLLKDFKGVLVSDFYAAYDSIDCPQQKCLIHLIRDLNDDVLKHPYDEELKQIIKRMKLRIVRFEISRPRFFRQTTAVPSSNIPAKRYIVRLEKNGNTVLVSC